MNVSHVSAFLEREVPRIAARLQGPGREADFRQEFLEGIRAALREDGLEPIIKLEERTLNGQTDARIEHFVFEFKSPGELSKKGPRETGLRKLREYLESKPKDSWVKYRGLLTDGFQAALAAYHLRSDRFLFLDRAGIPVPSGGELLPWAETAAPLSLTIPTMALPHLDSETLLEHFGLSTDVAQDALRALWKQLDEGKSEFTRLLYDQWRELFALAVEFTVTDQPGQDLIELFQVGRRATTKEMWDQAVFVVHTYYSLVLKLLALRIVDELGLAGRVSLLERVIQDPAAGMLDAERTVPQVLGNVIERDVFSWPYCDEEWPPTGAARSAIAEMATHMQEFDVQGVRTDVLRRVYQNMIPPKLRKSLGEFYTPTWAAELVLDEVGFMGPGRILDPTCGSGTFLVAAIQRSLTSVTGDPHERLAHVSGSVVGYDLNPIAIATSRLNYTLALVDVLLAAGALREPISIPVFLADSLLLPELESRGLAPHFRIPTRVGVFQVPILYPGKSDQDVVADTRRLLHLLREHCTGPPEAFLASLRKDFGAEPVEDSLSLLVKLHKTVFDLHVKKHDGIWTSMIENFFAPNLQGRFEFVVGNPPWVIPRRTPQTYTKRVREVVERSVGDRIVLQPAKRDFLVLQTRSAAAEHQYFACTPFVWRALRTYVAPKGRLAFLMTSSMFSAMGAGGWRKWISRFRIHKIADMTLVTDIHERALCWSYVPVIENSETLKDEATDFSFCIPMEKRGPEEWDLGPRRMEWRRWTASVSQLPIADSRMFNGSGRHEASDAPWQIAPSEVLGIVRLMQRNAMEANHGASRLGDIYPMHMGFKADGWRFFAFDGLPVIEDGIARGRNRAGEPVVIDSDFVFAIVVGGSLRPWGYTPEYAFLPLDPAGNDVDESELRRHNLTWQYLLNHKRSLSARAVVKKGYVDQWFGVLVPEDAKSTGKVAYRLISKQLEACVLPSRHRFHGGTSPLLPDQHVRFIPLDSVPEASYLAGLMNSSAMRCVAYLCSTPKGGVPWREFKAWNMGFIPVVRFHDENPLCQKISKLAEELARAPSNAEGRQEELDALVAQLYGISAAKARQLEEHLKRLQGHGTPGLESHP